MSEKVKNILIGIVASLVPLGVLVAIFWAMSPPAWPSHQVERRKVIRHCGKLVTRAYDALRDLGQEPSFSWFQAEEERCIRGFGLTEEMMADYQRFTRERQEACVKRTVNPAFVCREY